MPVEQIPQDIISIVMADLREGVSIRASIDNGQNTYMLTRRNGQTTAAEIHAIHRGVNGKEIPFRLSQESDGTRRIIDLLPAFIGLSETNESTTFVIDEIDRCLHHNVLRKLLELYLQNRAPEQQTQLIFTTQDLLLMNQDLFRRDEMWIADRDENGVSALSGICDFAPARYDKDILRSYLLGRMHGIPKVGKLFM